MIRVTVELVPFGIGTPRVIGRAEIANDGTGTPTVGNYKARFFGKSNRLLREVHFEGFPRKKKNAWHLLLCLLAIGFKDSL